MGHRWKAHWRAETIAAIRAADASEKAADIATRLGISTSTVYQYRWAYKARRFAAETIVPLTDPVPELRRCPRCHGIERVSDPHRHEEAA
jgi:hypothetical protein